jgi:hypothetical protein
MISLWKTIEINMDLVIIKIILILKTSIRLKTKIMKERIIHPEKPDDIVKELAHPNSEEIDQFAKLFPEDILKFAELFSEAYKKWLELNHCIGNAKRINAEPSQKDYIMFFSHQILDNLFTSMKMLLMGFQTASGNLMRQVAEGSAIVILLSLNFEIKREIRKRGKVRWKKFYYFKSFKEDKSYARSHKAIYLLEKNKDAINISEYGLNLLKLFKDNYNKYSHPTFFSTSSFVSLEKPGRLYIGGAFDDGKIEWYKHEIKSKIFFCDKLPGLIRGLIIKVKELPQFQNIPNKAKLYG